MISKVSIIKLTKFDNFLFIPFPIIFVVGKYFEIDALLPVLRESTQIDYSSNKSKSQAKLSESNGCAM